MLLKIKKSKLGKLLEKLENYKQDLNTALKIGLFIISLDEEISHILFKYESAYKSSLQKDGIKFHASIKRKEKGLTIHFKKEGDLDVRKELERDTTIMKYHKKFKTWYGLCYNPESDEIKYIIDCSYPWLQSNQMETLTETNRVSLGLTDDN